MGPQRDKLSPALAQGRSCGHPASWPQLVLDPRGSSIGRALGWAPDVQELRLCTGPWGLGTLA